MTLSDYQFEILPSDDALAGEGFSFGIGTELSLNDGGFDTGELSWEVQDSMNQRRGGTSFGRDVKSAMTWSWETHTDRQDAAGALETLGSLSSAWRPESAAEPGWVTALRYRVGGRTRRVFGRPRRLAAPPNNLILGGMVQVVHDFQCVDSFTYDDESQSVSVPYISTVSGGGWSFPASFPLSTEISEGTGGTQLDIGGDSRCYPVIRFNGPWVNPSIQTDEWSLTWSGTILAGGWVEIDPRPWKMTVTNHLGASAVAGLDRRVWLEDLWFAPGSRPGVALGGVSASGSASATISWRPTWGSL